MGTMRTEETLALTTKITAYDPSWPDMFIAERDRIANGFGADLIAIHHVGSTAVSGLAAKPEIDLLVEISGHRNTQKVDASCVHVATFVAKTFRPDTISTGKM